MFAAKLIFVGEGAAGKTSLLNRLIDPNSKLPEEFKRTKGIEVREWAFKEENNQNHIAYSWDFGGQDVYTPVHRFFITKDSLFILMASTRSKNSPNFEYWIPTIYQFGGNSPILIGQTCMDGATEQWNELDVFVNNPQYKILKHK